MIQSSPSSFAEVLVAIRTMASTKSCGASPIRTAGNTVVYRGLQKKTSCMVRLNSTLRSIHDAILGVKICSSQIVEQDEFTRRHMVKPKEQKDRAKHHDAQSCPFRGAVWSSGTRRDVRPLHHLSRKTRCAGLLQYIRAHCICTSLCRTVQCVLVAVSWMPYGSQKHFCLVIEWY